MKKLDKYEYNLKLEEIDKLVEQGDYEEAASLADSIDWRRVRNVRTLCLISEIYEASGRLEDSKNMLIRAYRRSPVGRTVLYRLVEVTTALQQYDEAIEYYTEYVQAAPHDNNRYILKYKIYKGRGSAPEELISILEEYLGQEYTERWAYELAKLYQQTGQMQKCLAACDDLVLWFHSGKYVAKALELKRRYASLTPRQQQIYEECLQAGLDGEPEKEEDEQETVIRNVPDTDGEVIAENIMAETEREIAGQVAAHRAEMEKGMQPDAPAEASAPAPEPAGEAEPEEAKDLQIELAKSMRKIISGVVRHPGDNEDDLPASIDPRFRRTQKPELPGEEEQIAGQLSIDDILLSMSDQGKKLTDLVVGEDSQDGAAQTDAGNVKAAEINAQGTASVRAADAGNVKAAEMNAQDAAADAQSAADTEKVRVAEINAQGAADAQNAADAENVKAAEIDAQGAADAQNVADAEKVRAAEIDAQGTVSGRAADAGNVKAAETNAQGAADARNAADEEKVKAAEINAQDAADAASGPVFRSVTEAAADELTDIQREALRYTNHPERLLRNKGSLPVYSEDDDLGKTRRIVNTKEELMEAAKKEILAEKTIRIPTGEISRRLEENAAEAHELLPDEDDREQPFSEETGQQEEYFDELGQQEPGNGGDEEEYLAIPQHLRGLFSGFTEVEGLEDQIANAIIQAEAKGDDKTSRSGNILIFGAHGSGKTTLAMNLAKAIAQDKGSQVMKIARIYAADLNHKDIAATIAKSRAAR